MGGYEKYQKFVKKLLQKGKKGVIIVFRGIKKMQSRPEVLRLLPALHTEKRPPYTTESSARLQGYYTSFCRFCTGEIFYSGSGAPGAVYGFNKKNPCTRFFVVLR
jgi:hypothetical protein